MAVSKRLRFEILRRDNHACRYCGVMAPEEKIGIDHVTPVALGGTDDPSNLVACCSACNSGKSATPPGAPLVADVSEDALRFQHHLGQAMKLMLSDHKKTRKYVKACTREWLEWRDIDGEGFPVPDDYESGLETFYARGIPLDYVKFAIEKSILSRKIYRKDKWRYMCGIIWRTLDQQLETAKQLQTAADAEATDGS